MNEYKFNQPLNLLPNSALSASLRDTPRSPSSSPSLPSLPSVRKKSQKDAKDTKEKEEPDMKVNRPPVTIKKPTNVTKERPKPEDMYQVVLHNDDSVAAEHVVQCLMQTFKHDTTMATKIMYDAHRRGQSIAEVEGEVLAKLHCQQLSSARLTVTMAKV